MNWIFIILYSFTIYKICMTQSDLLSKVKPILEKLDYTINPCDDFYGHVCGDFMKMNLPKTLSHLNQIRLIYEKTVEQMVKLVSEDIDPEEPKTFQLIKTYYQSCLNSTFIENRKLEPLHKLLKKLGGWPVLLGNSWNEKKFTWYETDMILKSLGYDPKYIFDFQVDRDYLSRAPKYILCLWPSDTYYKNLRHNDSLLKAYGEYMFDVAVQFGANRSFAVVEMSEVFRFETMLWQISETDMIGASEYISERMSIDKMQVSCPWNKDWLVYLNNITSPGMFDKKDSICIRNPVYVYAIERLLRHTPKRVIANYMLWRVIDASAKYLNKEIHDLKRLFVKSCTGISESPTRKEQCIKEIMDDENAMLAGISSMYLKYYLKNDTLNKVTEMISMIKETYENIVTKSWLNDDTKERALRKIALMKHTFGISNETLNLDFMDNYYENLHLEPHAFFENSMKLRAFLYNNTITNLKKTANETMWFSTAVAAIVDARFMQSYNTIVISSSIVQYPIYDEYQPECMNYGSIGIIIGHEMTHALKLPPWDEHGIRRSWWTINDQKQHDKRTQCFLKRYKNHTTFIKNDSLAHLTLNENIADNEGMKISLEAYRAWKKKNTKNESCHFLNYTDEQLYWISTAGFFCAKNSPEITKYRLFTDKHANNDLRVNMAVANSVDFAKSFNCPKGSAMNPEEKCSFW